MIEDSYQADDAGDPLASQEDSQVGDTSDEVGGTQEQVDGSSQEEEQVGADGQEPTPQAEGLAGTPFKDVPALVNSFKNLQRVVAQREQQIQVLMNNLKHISSMMQQQQTPSADSGKKSLTGDELLEALVKDPNGTIESLIERAFEAKYGAKIGGLESSVGRITVSEDVNTFIRTHPELTQQDEDEMVAIIQRNPAWRQLAPAEQMERAYEKLGAQRWLEHSRKSANRNAVQGAKGVASLGGKKTMLPAQGARDAFDDVLNLDKQERELYRR